LTRNAARGGRRPLHVKRKTPRQGKHVKPRRDALRSVSALLLVRYEDTKLRKS